MPTSLPTNFFIPDDDYNDTVAGGGPAHAILPPSEANSDDALSEKIQQAMAKVLTGRLDDIFETVKEEMKK